MGDVKDIRQELAKKEFSDLKTQFAKQLGILAEVLHSDAAEMAESSDPREFTEVVRQVAETLTEASEKWSDIWEALRSLGR